MSCTSGWFARDRRRNVLQQHGLTGFRRRDNEAALAFADRRDHVDDARREIFRAAVALLELEPLLREQRRQVLEQHLALRGFGRVVIDLADLQQREVPLAVLRRANQAGNRVTRTQIEASDLARAHVDVVGPGEVGTIRGTQEAEAVLQDLEHAFAEDALAVLGVRFQDREDDVLFARAGEILDAHRLAELHERRDRARLQLGEIHRILGLLELRGRNDVELFVVRKLFAHRAIAATSALTLAVVIVAIVARLPRPVLHSGASRIA